MIVLPPYKGSAVATMRLLSLRTRPCAAISPVTVVTKKL